MNQNNNSSSNPMAALDLNRDGLITRQGTE
jgi:hypothetical protein